VGSEGRWLFSPLGGCVCVVWSPLLRLCCEVDPLCLLGLVLFAHGAETESPRFVLR